MTRELRQFVSALLHSRGIDGVTQILQEFSEQNWTLEERSIVSAVYTPRVKRLLANDENQYRRLEDLAELCWTPKRRV